MAFALVINRSRSAAPQESAGFAHVAERHRRSGDWHKAVALCRDGLKKFPEHVSARVTLGLALLDLQQFNDARAELQLALKRAPDNLAAIRGLAQLHDHHDYGQDRHDYSEDAVAPGPWPSLNAPTDLPAGASVASERQLDPAALSLDANQGWSPAAPVVVEPMVTEPSDVEDFTVQAFKDDGLVLPSFQEDEAFAEMEAATDLRPETPAAVAFDVMAPEMGPAETPLVEAETAPLVSAQPDPLQLDDMRSAFEAAESIDVESTETVETTVGVSNQQAEMLALEAGLLINELEGQFETAPSAPVFSASDPDVQAYRAALPLDERDGPRPRTIDPTPARFEAAPARFELEDVLGEPVVPIRLELAAPPPPSDPRSEAIASALQRMLSKIYSQRLIAN